MQRLEVSGVRKTFGLLTALDGVDLDVAPGEIRGLIGPNGSGKSTLMHVISGRLTANEGTVRLGDRDLSGTLPSARARAGMSIKFQHARIYREQTVRDNLLLALQAHEPIVSLILGRTRRTHQLRIDELAEAFHLAGVRDALAGELSHGEQQWLEVAMAAASRPSLLLLDEPTAGMSPEERGRTGELIKTLSKESTIIIVEHDLDFIRDLCDTISVLHHGQVIANGTPHEIERDSRVAEVFTSRV